jgi:hypothetical protein
MTEISQLKAGVVGTGFIGVVHDALRRLGGPSEAPDYPTFRDGHIENVLCDAVGVANRERSWVEVPS